MNIDLQKNYEAAKHQENQNKKFFSRLKKTKPANLDLLASNAHNKVFANIDCLKCANCCSTISPMITDKDIARIAKYLKFRPAVFTEKFLYLDNENDYVFNQSPCPFLGSDNYCSIYDARPKACAEYPHTNRKHFVQILDLTLKNTFVCPAAFEVVEELKKNYCSHF